MLSKLFNSPTPIIGMVHLPPLPGAPNWTSYQALLEVEKLAKADVQALISGGVDGIIFENFGDAPFTKGKVDTLTISSMTRVVLNCTKNLKIPFGINILRNDWEGALVIAAVTGAAFIRINVLTGVYATDQGLIEGEAYSCIRLRKSLEHDFGCKIQIFADVHVKHGTPLQEQNISEATKDLVERVGVDGLIVTGTRTGTPPTRTDVNEVIKSGRGVPVLIGSGVDPKNVKKYSQLTRAHELGFIVGSYFKEEGRLDWPIKKELVSALVKVLK